jgi:hypothetical protein
MSKLLHATLIATVAACGASASPVQPAVDEPHDFDFHVGTWTTRISRLTAPLSGSSDWVEYEGTTVVREIWGGRATLVELIADGPAGHLELLSLRLFDPETRQWSLHVASSRGGGLSPPVVGAFVDGRGEFLGTETIDGRELHIRFVIDDITATSARFEQAFSADGGATWEVNWIATDTRVSSTTPG